MIKCYCCRQPVLQSHDFYKQLCIECGEKNWSWRTASQDLTGYTALVTGARIKIGYYTSLRLLRNGANVIATTRFPNLARELYQREPDYKNWSDRLYIWGLDLLQIDLIGEFLEKVYRQFNSLEIIINNAAQTLKDAKELHINQLLETQKALENSLDTYTLPTVHTQNEILKWQSFDLMETDKNSWVKYSKDISIREFLEVQIINVTSPYLLATGLKELLESSPKRNRFVINVSSVEGKFQMKNKSSAHPHTNMAKAALNMMTKTLAKEYRKSNISIYSIDPGWVSNQFPTEWASSSRTLPLDYEDAAARVTQPIFEWKDIEKPPTGIFIKDYETTEW